MAKKVLIIDDELNVVTTLQSRLTANHYHAIPAYSGNEGLEKIQREKPNLIILDVLMPGMSGLNFFEKIRSMGIKTPVIVISARPAMKEFFEEDDICCFLSKPYNPEELLSRIENVLGPGIEGRTVVLIGAQDFVVGKVEQFLQIIGVKVFVANDEEDAIFLVKKHSPDYLLCQYWDNTSVLDVARLCEKLEKDSSTYSVPHIIFSPANISIDAMKSFKASQIVSYNETSDLTDGLRGRLGLKTA